MPTSRKQKKARKSRGVEMLSDIENLDSYPNPGENRSSNSANYGHNSAGTDFMLNLVGYQVNLT